jgi:alkylation response protein AidB-like acyl-CoA dehydrogenase
MDYQHSEAHKQLKEKMGKFFRDEIAPGAAFLDSCGRDEAIEKMKSNLKKLASEGYLELLVSDDFTGQAVAGEELASACPSTFLTAMSSATAFGRLVKLFGDDRQQNLLAPLTAGDSVGALAFTEGDAGSDMNLMQTVAERKDSGWVLNGCKDLVTNAPIADTFLVLAWTDRNAGLEKGATLFLINRNTEGLSIGDHVETMGLRGALTAGVHLKDCTLTDDAVLGGTIGAGWVQLQRILDEIKIAVSVLCVGIGVTCMDDSTKHAKGKKAFGKPIGLFEGVGAKLATMYTLNDIGRMLVYRASWAMEIGDPEKSVLTSCVKLFTSEGVEQISSMAMQVNGGHGYLKGSVAERLYRDARFAALAYGTSEMQRSFIAKDTLDQFRAA